MTWLREWAASHGAFGDALAALWTASWQAAVLAMLVLGLRAALGERLRPRWRAALWLVVLARLALPWTPPSPFSVFNAARALGVDSPAVAIARIGAPTAEIGVSPPRWSAAQIEAMDEGLDPLDLAPVAGVAAPAVPVAVASTSAESPPLLAPALGVVWLLGVLAVAGRVVVCQRRATRLVAGSRQVCDERAVSALSRVAAGLGLRGPVMLAESPGVGSPVLVGAVRPVVVLPRGLAARLTGVELEGVLAHELAHVRRGDILVAWFAAAALAVHWFNPLAWVAAAMLRRDRELACDEAVLETLADEERLGYGRTLVKLVEDGVASRSGAVPGLAAIVEDSGDIRRRLTMIARYRSAPSSRRAALLAAPLLVLLAAAGLTDAQVAGAGGTPKPPKGGDTEVVKESGSELGVYTMPYNADEDGRVTLPKNAEWKAMPRYNGVKPDGSRVRDERITLVLQDAGQRFWPILCKLSTADAETLLESVGAAIAAREKAGADNPARPGVHATIYTKNLEMNEHKGAILPAGSRIAAAAESPVIGGAKAEPRVTVTITPAGKNEPAAVIRMDLPIARRLAADLREQVDAKRADADKKSGGARGGG